jgi:hypothetical protein
MNPINRNTYTHGHLVNRKTSPTYNSWNSMKTRCTNPKVHNWNNYGGRGITVCERWSHSFTNFLADMGPKPEGMSIDRTNNDGDYEPTNCRWATKKDQMNNKRQANQFKKSA